MCSTIVYYVNFKVQFVRLLIFIYLTKKLIVTKFNNSIRNSIIKNCCIIWSKNIF